MLELEDEVWAGKTLKSLDFFIGCSDKDITSLVENMDKSHYKGEATILFSGEFSNRFFLIKKGSVGIWKSVDGEKKMVADLGEGKYFGEISLMTPSGATATVKALSDCEVLTLTFENFEIAFKDNPDRLKAIQRKIEERKQTLSPPAK